MQMRTRVAGVLAVAASSVAMMGAPAFVSNSPSFAVTGRRIPAGCPAPGVMAILVIAPPDVRYPPRTGTS